MDSVESLWCRASPIITRTTLNATPRQGKAADSDSDGGDKKRKRGAKKKKVSCGSSGGGKGGGIQWDVYRSGCRLLVGLIGLDCVSVPTPTDKTNTNPAQRVIQDPNAPKRSMTAFMLFTAAKRAEVKEEQPDLKARRVID